jgi:hypothetical protein
MEYEELLNENNRRYTLHPIIYDDILIKLSVYMIIIKYVQ